MAIKRIFGYNIECDQWVLDEEKNEVVPCKNFLTVQVPRHSAQWRGKLRLKAKEGGFFLDVKNKKWYCLDCAYRLAGGKPDTNQEEEANEENEIIG